MCWSSVGNPTEAHRTEAGKHRQRAAEHRAASSALREAEARACVDIAPDDRDISPFLHEEDIASVEPLIAKASSASAKVPKENVLGAIVTFRAVPGMTAAWFQREVDCHLARNASLGNDLPEMAICPLSVRGVSAQVSTTVDGFAVAIRAKDAKTAEEVLARARKLMAESNAPDPVPAASES